MEGYTPITFLTKKIGWIFKSTAKEILKKEIVENKIDFSLLNKSYFKDKEYSKNEEQCPVFYYNSLQPKLLFSENIKFCEENIFIVNRKDLSLFGLPAYGIHCNVWSKIRGNFIIYFAKRSKKLNSFPGYFDNPIAGGQPTGISIINNLYKEGFEEAGLKKTSFQKVLKGRTVNYSHNIGTRLISAVIFNYHLEKPSEIKLKNIDGEVEDFFSLPLYEVYKYLENKSLKPNCIIPILDFILLNEYEFISNATILEIRKILKVND